MNCWNKVAEKPRREEKGYRSVQVRRNNPRLDPGSHALCLGKSRCSVSADRIACAIIECVPCLSSLRCTLLAANNMVCIGTFRSNFTGALLMCLEWMLG